MSNSSLAGVQSGLSLTRNMTDRIRCAVEMLIAGVAFQKDGKTWTVISHDGDFMGEISTFMVSETTCLLKKTTKLKVSSLKEYGGNQANPGAGCITFGHNRFSESDQVQIRQIMERRFKRPLTLM